MNTIEYEIGLNETGRPFIGFPAEYKPTAEDRFMALELARYIILTTHGRMTIPPFNQDTIDKIGETLAILGQISDEVAEIIWHNMKAAGEAQMILGAKFHVQCENIEDRNKIDDRGILYFGKLYQRQEGLKVLCQDNDNVWKIYELKDGITNENWVEVL